MLILSRSRFHAASAATIPARARLVSFSDNNVRTTNDGKSNDSRETEATCFFRNAPAF